MGFSPVSGEQKGDKVAEGTAIQQMVSLAGTWTLTWPQIVWGRLQRPEGSQNQSSVWIWVQGRHNLTLGGRKELGELVSPVKCVPERAGTR